MIFDRPLYEGGLTAQTHTIGDVGALEGNKFHMNRCMLLPLSAYPSGNCLLDCPTGVETSLLNSLFSLPLETWGVILSEVAWIFREHFRMHLWLSVCDWMTNHLLVKVLCTVPHL